MSPKTACCMQRGPNCAAGRTPVHDLTAVGGFHRRSPTGGAANGTPRNARTPVVSFVTPSTTPFAVVARGAAPPFPPAAAAPLASAPARQAAAATRIVLRVSFMKDVLARMVWIERKCTHAQRAKSNPPSAERRSGHERRRARAPR